MARTGSARACRPGVVRFALPGFNRIYETYFNKSGEECIIGVRSKRCEPFLKQVSPWRGVPGGSLFMVIRRPLHRRGTAFMGIKKCFENNVLQADPGVEIIT